MRNRTISNLAALTAAVAFGVLATTSTALAQPPQQQQRPAVDVSEEKLETFAEAYLDVRDIQEQMEAEMGQVADPQEAQSVQENYNEQIIGAIEDQGISADEYQSLVTTVNSDPDVRDQFFAILERLEEEREG